MGPKGPLGKSRDSSGVGVGLGGHQGQGRMWRGRRPRGPAQDHMPSWLQAEPVLSREEPVSLEGGSQCPAR